MSQLWHREGIQVVQGSLGEETKLGVLGSQGDEMEQDGEERREPRSAQSGGARAHEQRPTRDIIGSVSRSPRALPSALPEARLVDLPSLGQRTKRSCQSKEDN